jgi:hypothetical protein
MPRIERPAPRPKTSAEIGTDLVNDVRLALGQEPDLVLWRSSVAGVEVWDEKTGRSRWQHAGLPKGSADLVGILRVRVAVLRSGNGPEPTPVIADFGRWFCLEIKAPGVQPRRDQREWLELVQKFGGFAWVVHSVDEARAALDRARRGLDS